MFDDSARVAALGPDDLEHVLGDLAGDRLLADQVDDAAELRGRDGRVLDAVALPVQPPEQLVDDPVRGGLAVPPLGRGFKEVGRGALGHEHAGVIGERP